MQEPKICPYPGLRPFTEEESIFFKGRDRHIEKIISQLEEKKFVMLTGASGDGKSSIIYAGVIPNARAGFFKARFNKWIIADFRPERDPLKNLAHTLSTQLNLDPDKVQKELKFGFSALVDLYKTSKYYLDVNSEDYLNADEKGKKTLKRNASNLFILVDQFEEFFTNKENFSHGRPSLEAQLVVNLMIETVKMSLDQDLPIYIVFTMRSDYIGQCAGFRGLPEYIGISQFFIPRLKRKEIYQVIDEPAKMSDNKISKRLVETLINAMREGFDQLPVLQHALYQLWKKADNGNLEMDLIHLAKLSGLDSKQLTKKDQDEFNYWYKNTLAVNKDFEEIVRQDYENPSLENVLHTHANELYVKAHAYYTEKFPLKKDEISSDDARLIVKKSFQCLTKIDSNRAVRNRMTLQEITDIINIPRITTAHVGGILNIFREQGNTFLTPFISDKPSSVHIRPETVLDITHESLIRNWELLGDWTIEENEFRQTFQDFEKQLMRWVDNNKSRHYLLSVGPLSFFESWYQNINLSHHWLMKYDDRELPLKEKREQAVKIIADANEFIKSSRRAITRKRNIIISVTISIIIVLTGFSGWAFLERGKALKQQTIAQQQTIEANKAKEDAINSEQSALKAKEAAQKSELIAIAAKDTANQAKETALRSKAEALKQKSIAESEARKAFEQSMISQKMTLLAKDEAAKAEEQRKISDTERRKAEIAENKAKQLTLISIAQNIALKSSMLNDNPQLKGNLALQAYLFTKNNEGQTQDPLIFESLSSAYSLLSTDQSLNVLKGSSDEAGSLICSQKNPTLISGGKDGKIRNWNLSTGKLTGETGLSFNNPSCFIAISPDEKNIITGHTNNEVILWKIADGGKTESVKLKGHGGQLRAAAFSSDGKFVATGGKDSLIIIWDIATGSSDPVKIIPVPSFIKTLIYNVNETSLIAGAENGEIISISSETFKVRSLFKSSSTPISLCINSKSNILIAGYSDGKIRVFDLNTASSRFSQFNNGNVSIDEMAVNNDATLLAVSSADKVIKIYDLQHLDRAPIIIDNHKSKVRSITFDQANRLIAGCEDKSIRIWETSADIIARDLCQFLKRSLTSTEWEQFIGPQFPYSKTCDLP